MKRLMFEEIERNKIKSWILIFSFIIIISLIGLLFSYFYDSYSILLIVIFVSVFYSMIAYNSGDSMILSMLGAKEADKIKHASFINSIQGLAIAAGIPAPKAYVIEDSALNAFATGKEPKTASITITTGLLEKLNREELEGVVAHEMSHIKNYDIRFMMLAVVLAGLITLLSDFFLRSFLYRKRSSNNSRSKGGSAEIIFIAAGLILAILSPLIGKIIQLAVSRQREYLADANSVVLTRNPTGIINALKKISTDPDPLVDSANKATAHLFISSPFKKNTNAINNLFSTHPPINDRIKKLQEM
ncbi:MAG: M48 family metallopeptidase [Candidatus Nanoarchaeia archaeon]|nr:M48 family metallopeptidase [Candidatus Nanoarchaeia archaeon]